MKPSPAGPARELEPQAPARGEQRAAEPEGRWREKGEADTERQRTRERQEATLAGLAELEYLRQRQELLVRGALRGAGVAPRAGEPPGEAAGRGRLEEKFLEENILLLRKQLVGRARRRRPCRGRTVGQVAWAGREGARAGDVLAAPSLPVPARVWRVPALCRGRDWRPWQAAGRGWPLCLLCRRGSRGRPLVTFRLSG